MDAIVDWSDGNITTLKTMWAAGRSHSQIAAEIPYATRSAIAGKIMRLKLPARDKGHPTPQRSQFAASTRIITLKPKAPPPRRNQTNSLTEKIAIAEAEPGLSPRLMGEKPDGTGIKFDALNHKNCHWPKGDPQHEDFEFCGGNAIPGMPYCAHHCRMSYSPATSRPFVDRRQRT